MTIDIRKIIEHVPRALKDPLGAIYLFWRRMVPFGIFPKDAEAYRIGSWAYGEAQRLSLPEIFPGIEGVSINLKRAYDRTRDLSLDAQELMAICAIVSYKKPKRILEIGTSDGITTINILVNSPPDARITTVDLPINWNGKFAIQVPELMKNNTEGGDVGRKFRDEPESSRITQVLGDSAQLDYSRLDGPFDFIFIDGCHFYDYVKVDTLNAIANLSSGGVIVWHDYGMVDDVSRVIDEMPGLGKVEVVAGTRLAIATPPN
jgi:Methyltransferase domain